MGSPFGSLNSVADWKKIGMGALMSLAGLAVAYITTNVIPLIDQSQASGMVAVAAFSVVANMIRKWLSDTQAPPAPPPPTGGVP